MVCFFCFVLFLLFFPGSRLLISSSLFGTHVNHSVCSEESVLDLGK